MVSRIFYDVCTQKAKRESKLEVCGLIVTMCIINYGNQPEVSEHSMRLKTFMLGSCNCSQSPR